MVLKSEGAAAFVAVLLSGGTTSLPIIWGHWIVEATDGGAQECSEFDVRIDGSFR